MPRAGAAVWNTAPVTSGFLQLCAAFCYFCYLCYVCLLFGNTQSRTHPPTANLCSSCTRPVQDRPCHAWVGRMEYSPPYPGLLAGLCRFVLLCATFVYFLPIPTAKRTRLQLTCALAARARHQSISAACGGGRVEYSSCYPGPLTALCSFVLLCATFATFAYFCLFFANTHSQTHPPTANVCSSCTRPVPEHPCHARGRPRGIQLPLPRASCRFVQL